MSLSVAMLAIPVNRAESDPHTLPTSWVLYSDMMGLLTRYVPEMRLVGLYGTMMSKKHKLEEIQCVPAGK